MEHEARVHVFTHRCREKRQKQVNWCEFEQVGNEWLIRVRLGQQRRAESLMGKDAVAGRCQSILIEFLQMIAFSVVSTETERVFVK